MTRTTRLVVLYVTSEPGATAMRFEELLSRADDEVLQELVGSRVVRLLNLLDPQLARPRRLRELLSSIHPPEELLRDAGTRRQLLDLLPRDEARGVVDFLGLLDPDPYHALHEARFPKGSLGERRLFAALGVVPVEVETPDRAPALSQSGADYALFAYQRLAARRAWQMLDTSPNRVLLHMPTGSGKTRTTMHLVARELRRREPCVVIWLAFSEELCEQAATEFETCWRKLGDRPVDVYRYWGNRQLTIDRVYDGFMVAGLAKVYATAKKDLDFLMRLSDRSSLVIIDEAHQAIAESYRFVLDVLVERTEGSRLLGLTATPGRTWNEPDKDRQLADFFARRKVTLDVEGYANPVDYLVDEGYLARPLYEDLKYAATKRLPDTAVAALADALDIPEDVLAELAIDEQRNLLIVTRVEQLAVRHQRIIVFAATVPHARLLATVLRARGIEADALTAATPSGERARLIAKYRSTRPVPMVLCNYGVLTAGFDAPKTSAAVIARPTKSLVLYSQMVGRATRGPRAGGNAEAEIVTVVDTSLPGFGQMSDAFRNWEDVW
jgi:DNA repair protein RadD